VIGRSSGEQGTPIAGGAVRTDGRRPRILLVDDEPSVRDLLRIFLESRGFDLTVASTGEEALDALGGGRRFDLLVTDIHLPDSPGQELARLVRERAPGTRVVFISGAPEVTAALVEQGWDGVLTKPFAMKELDRVVRAAVERAA